jgi:NAD(P)-dependent dehydrogenase (short-subunit alcohol dehydrogenase family)
MEEYKMNNYLGYDGKVVVVTGASSGMGKATAEMLVNLNAKVYALDWNDCNVEGIEKFIHVDLSLQESIDNAMKELPNQIDCYFGIAGVSGSKHDFLTTVSIDFVANKYICEEYLMNRMKQGGAIAFMTSTGGNGWEKEENKQVFLPSVEAKGWQATIDAIKETGLHNLPGTLGYPYSKLAMNYYTVYLQRTFASKGIRVNAVLPGSTSTGMKDEFTIMAGGEEALLSHCGYANRLAESKEMAGPIVFLNSSLASYASGVLMEVDFGNTAEERAGIRKNNQPISLTAILQMMQQKQ